jgi:uncharacterized membrane protein
MINIPINAEVNCTDGSCGESTVVIVNPVNRSITHVVVRANWLPHNEYLVPVDQIAETTPETITLNCARAHFEELQLFAEMQFEPAMQLMPDYGWDTMMVWPYTVPETYVIPTGPEQVPHGEIAIRKGTYVQATDGPVGQVDELLVDPATGEITHLVLREGHLWGKKILTLPLAEIDRVDDDNVYLKLDKAAVAALPAVPVKHHADLTRTELLILTLDTAPKAAEALKALKQLKKERSIPALVAAVLEKDDEGKTSVRETADVKPRQGTLFGAVTGGLVGLLGGPVGAVVGAAAGAAAGRAAAGRIDLGLPDEYLDELQESLQPGSSALVVLVNSETAGLVSEALKPFGGQLLRHPITEEIAARLKQDPASGSD